MGSHALIFQLEFHGLGDVVIWCVWIIKLGPQVNSLSTSWACSKPSLLVSPPIQLALLCHPQRRWKLSRISNSNWIQRNLKKKKRRVLLMKLLWLHSWFNRHHARWIKCNIPPWIFLTCYNNFIYYLPN
jgi:hypothetical protein